MSPKYFQRMNFAPQPTRIVPRMAKANGLRKLLLLTVLTIELADLRLSDHLQLAALHLFLEHTELRLLSEIEHLVDRIGRAPRIGLAAGIDLLQLLERVPQHAFVRLCIHQQAT